MSDIDAVLDRAENLVLAEAYRRRASDWLRPVVSRARVVNLDELEALDAVVAAGILTGPDIDELARLDLIVIGRSPDPAAGDAQLYGAVSARGTLEIRHIEACARRAELLRKAQLDVVAIAVCYRTDENVGVFAAELGVSVQICE